MGGACCGWCVGRVLWLRSISCSPLDGGRIPPRRCYLVGRVQKIGRLCVLGGASWGNWGLGRKSAGFLYGWASEDGAWVRCVWGVSGVRLGRGRGACTGLGKFAPLKRSDLGKWEREVQMCQNQCIFHAPPAHLLPQYCTLLGKTRPRHRPHSGTAGTTSSPFRGCVGGEPLLVGHAWRACGFFAGVPLDGTCAGLMGGAFLSCGAAHCPSFL